MAEVGEVEPGKERSGWEMFTEAAKIYGAEGLSYEKLPDGREVLRQKLGEGWHGFGYDGTNFWLGLTTAKEREDFTAFAWNGNTKLRPSMPHKGIVTGENGKLLVDHPISQLFSQLRVQVGVEVHITGEHVNWEKSDRTRLQPENDGSLSGNIPVGGEIKAVIINLPAHWDDSGWVFGREQKLTILPRQ